MKKMNIPLIGSLLLLSLVVCPILYLKLGPALNELQIETLKTIGTIAGCSAFLCFVLGEITRNNSQVDKIWSILPFVYCWIIAVKGGMHPQLVVMAVLATLCSIGAGIGIVNWSMIGALLLIVLFLGSTSLAEEISSGKYPEYADYCKKVNKYFPGKILRP